MLAINNLGYKLLDFKKSEADTSKSYSSIAVCLIGYLYLIKWYNTKRANCFSTQNLSFFIVLIDKFYLLRLLFLHQFHLRFEEFYL